MFSFGEFTGGGPDKQSQWPAFCHALGLASLLEDPNCDQNGKNSAGLGADASAYRSIYEAAFQHKSAHELVELIRSLEGAAYPYHTHETLFADEQARTMQMLCSTSAGDARAIKMPWNFSGMQRAQLTPAPTLGNATGRVLAELGYSTQQRAYLFNSGSVVGEDAGTTDAITPRTPSAMASVGNAELPDAPAARPRQHHRGGPLDGIRVMDISGMGVGPVTGLFLAELGAEVIKVEPPHGDLALTVPPTQCGTSVLYLAANLGKRGIFLNLKDPHDLERAYRLAEQSDVFIENFRVGVVDRLGLSYETLAARNPRLIYCSLSGFDPRGPLAPLPSIDTYIQAFSGFASLNGAPGSRGESLRNIGFIDLSTSEREREVARELVSTQRPSRRSVDDEPQVARTQRPTAEILRERTVPQQEKVPAESSRDTASSADIKSDVMKGKEEATSTVHETKATKPEALDDKRETVGRQSQGDHHSQVSMDREQPKVNPEQGKGALVILGTNRDTTGNQLPGFFGRANPNTTLEIVKGETVLGQIRVRADGTWRCKCKLPPGDHTLVVRELNKPEVASVPKVLTVSNFAPPMILPRVNVSRLTKPVSCPDTLPSGEIRGHLYVVGRCETLAYIRVVPQ